MRTILVVEDDEQVVGLLRTILGDSYLLYDSPSGESALRLLAYIQVNLIILDLTLAGQMTGMETLAVIKSSPELRHVPVIIISGTESTHEVDQAERLGAARFIKKPYSPTWLRQEMEKLLPSE